MRRKPAHEIGFTLVEVLVALVIFALASGAIFEVFAGAARRAEKARARETLALTAQSLLAELRVRPSPWLDEERGTLGRLQWSIRVQPFDAGLPATAAWNAYLVRVIVGDADARNEFTLESIEMAKVLP